MLTAPNRIINDDRPAKTILVSGPATPIKAAPYSPNLTLLGLKGTGLAMKIGGIRRSINAIGIKIVVNKSMCFKGLSVNLPKSLAVVSPNQCEVKACIASCIAIDKIIETITINISTNDKLLSILVSISGQTNSCSSIRD